MNNTLENIKLHCLVACMIWASALTMIIVVSLTACAAFAAQIQSLIFYTSQTLAFGALVCSCVFCGAGTAQIYRKGEQNGYWDKKHASSFYGWQVGSLIFGYTLWAGGLCCISTGAAYLILFPLGILGGTARFFRN